jgi:microcystin synthetase protein McyJ
VARIPVFAEWQNRLSLFTTVLRHPRRELSFLLKPYTSDDLYTRMAKRDPHLGDPDVPHWLNFGYWKQAQTYADACAAMARLLADAAALSPTDQVLDVGFGFAEQDLQWVRERDVAHIHGINITPLQVDVAQQRVARAGLTDRIDLGRGSATAIPFPAERFTKVTALECALHFDTRSDFFAEAYRVLKPGGRLALTDCLPLPGTPRSLWLRLASKQMSIPFENQYDRHEYLAHLSRAGFTNLSCTPIGEYVWPAMVRYFAEVGRGVDKHDLHIDLRSESSTVDDWSRGRGWFMGFDDYVLIHADKPAHD